MSNPDVMPLATALAKLDPLLVGAGWIEKLTARETWLVNNYAPYGSRIGFMEGTSIRYVGPGGMPITNGLTGIAAEAAAAHERSETMRSQWDQVEDWLDEHALLDETADGLACIPAQGLAEAMACLSPVPSSEREPATQPKNSAATSPAGASAVAPRRRPGCSSRLLASRLAMRGGAIYICSRPMVPTFRGRLTLIGTGC